MKILSGDNRIRIWRNDIATFASTDHHQQKATPGNRQFPADAQRNRSHRNNSNINKHSNSRQQHRSESERKKHMPFSQSINDRIGDRSRRTCFHQYPRQYSRRQDPNDGRSYVIYSTDH